MAIKVGGTEVITNARQLSNIASVDSTTVAALGVAGVGGGGGIELTTSEAVVEGDPLAFNFTTGKVEKIGRTGGNSRHYVYNSQSGANIQIFDVLHIPEIDKVAVLGSRSDGNKVVYLGTFNGTSWTWGTPFEGDSGGTGEGGKLVWAANVSRLVAIYKSSNSGNFLKYRLLSASGSNLTSEGHGVFGTSAADIGASGNQCQAIYSPTHQRIIVGFSMSNSPYGMPIIVGSVSSSSILWSAEQGHNGSAPNQRIHPADQVKNLGIAVNGSQIAFGYYSYSASRYYVSAATMSGSTLTFGSHTGIGSSYTYNQNARGQMYHVSGSSTSGLFAYIVMNSNQDSYAYHFTISGTSVNAIGANIMGNHSNYGTNGFVTAYDPANDRVFDFKSNSISAQTGTDTALLRMFTNNTMTASSGAQSAVFHGVNSKVRSATYDEESGRAVFINSQNPTRIYTYFPITDNYHYFVGCALEAASANTTVKIANAGTIATGLSGLTAGMTYRIQYDGNWQNYGNAITQPTAFVNSTQRNLINGVALTSSTMLMTNDFISY